MKVKFATLLIGFMALFVTGMSVQAQTDTATIKTDLDDYAPGSTAIITGTGFQPGETVVLEVAHTEGDTYGTDPQYHETFSALADANGNVSSSWFVPLDGDALGATFILTADGQSSGRHAEWLFTDANLRSVDVGSQIGSITYGTGGSVTYLITVNSNGNSTPYNVVLSISGLPSGVTSPGFPQTINNVGQSGTTTTLTLVVPNNTPASLSPYTFTVKATNGGSTKSGDGTLTMGKKALTGSITASNKEYDQLTSAAIATRILTGVIGTDVVSYTGGTAMFSDKNAGTGKTVNATGLSLAGADAANYTVNSIATTTANIIAKSITVGATGVNRIYNGAANIAATVNLVDDRIAGDVLTDSYTAASFADGNAGTGKTVNVSGISIAGADAANYSLSNTTAATSANITALGITGTFTANSKIYDESASAGVLTTSLTGLIAPDDVSLSGGTATFSDKNVADGKTVTLSGAVLIGPQSGNYTLNSVNTTIANITPLAIVGSITVANKIYSGTTSATITNRSLTGVLGSDVVNYTGGTATFSDKNVADGKTVNATGLSLGGGDKNNYTVNPTATALANITPATLTPSVVANNKVYDGTTNATLSSQTVSPILLTDVVNLFVGAATFSDANADTGKTVTANTLSLGGGDGGNYILSSSTATAFANILKATATVTVHGYTGTYDAAPHGATGTVTGVAADLTATGSTLNLGASFTDYPGGTAYWTFTGGTNYNDQSGTAAIVINKAASTTIVTITGAPFTYNGLAQTPATVTITGAGGLSLTSTPFYVNNINAGIATASYTFAGDANHEGSNDSETFTIGKASSITVVTIAAGPFTYTGSALTPATVSVIGAGGLNLAPTADYANNTNAGTGTASYSFTGDANHEVSTDSKTFTIGKASSTTVITIAAGPFTYTGSALTPAIVSVTGAGGVSLAPTADYANNINAGTATASYIYEGDDNHEGSQDSKNFTIDKAASMTTVTVPAGPFTYSGSALMPATVSVTGAGGLSLAPTADYAKNINAGTATASYSFTGDANHEGSTGSKTFSISKAAAVITVNPYSVTYDGNAHTSTFTAVGVESPSPVNLAALMTVTGTTHTNAGTYAADAWTFAGNSNYNTTSGTVNNAIDKAEAVITVNPYSVTYDGNAHTSSFTATGVETTPADLTGLVTVSATTHTNAGTYTADAWTFAGNTNYNATSGTVDNAIAKAILTVTADPQSKYCGQINPSLTFQYSGWVGGVETIDTAPIIGTVVSSTTTAGTYANAITLAEASDNNYSFNYVFGTFSVVGLTSIDASASSNPVSIGTAATLSATVSPAVAGIQVLFTLDNGNGGITTYSAVTNGSGVAMTTATNLAVEVYLITAKAGNNCASAIAYLPVYDPNGSFITGGGWINSPEGALVGKTTTGKANFGFNAKYKKGNNEVDGNTEFQFQEGNFNFKSNLLNAGTLVISGAKATFRGTGTVNGFGNYGFLIAATDAAISGGGIGDKFRIKIWNTANGNTTVYDNQMNQPENADASTIIGGGSIVIHQNGGKLSSSTPIAGTSGGGLNMKIVEPIFEQNIKLAAYPNPFGKHATIVFTLPSDERLVTLDVYDLKGSRTQRLYEGKAKANQTLEFEYNGSSLPAGMYFLRLTTPKKVENFKMIMTD